VLNLWYAGRINLHYMPSYDCINFLENLFFDQVIYVYCGIWPSLHTEKFMSHTLLPDRNIEERKRMAA
jgi:hypothetical protein